MSSIPVTVVGPRSSGKTVYLASLFARLSQQDPELGFSVSVPLSQSQRLNHIYEQAVGPGDWPLPNFLADSPTWDFTCKVRTAQRRVLHPFAVSYADYAGELLTNGDEQSEAFQRVESLVRTSPFLLILLDGEKVLRFLAGDPRLLNELWPILNCVNDNVAGVVHIVVTKWDLLVAAGHTLADVADGLRGSGGFRNFVDARRDFQDGSGIVRLIPVSSVGLDFARLDENGIVVKTPGARAVPLNVELPFMAIVVDLFTTSLRQFAKAREDGSLPVSRSLERQRRVLQGVSGTLPLVKAFLRLRVAKAPVLQSLGEDVLGAFAAYVADRERSVGKRIEEDAAALRQAVAQATTDQEVMARIAKAFQARLEEFEDEYPGSRLDLWGASE
ncbi:hypothetical protein [Kitasatospora sp. NPDC093806]|uniref:hypothetical protein n=1 Tax=Kitasatospora sp. NPDC093806 TaxID=3155075 RepID=UPI00343B794A